MIVRALLNIVYGLLSLLMLPISFIEFPESVTSVIADIIVYVGDGFRILMYYTHFWYLLDLAAIVVGVDAFILGYKVVMFILKKIPFLNLS